MTTQTNWRVLASGATDRALLAVDFGPGRREAGFADLVGNLAPDAAVWQPVFQPQVDDPVDGTDPGRQAGTWLDDLHAANLRVRGVLGYCAGATLAVRVGDLLQVTDPVVVLLDPSRVDGAVIQEHFVSSAEGYAEVLPPERIQAAVADSARITGSLGADLAEMSVASLTEAMREVQRLYDGVVQAVCESIDADDELGSGFSKRFAAFLSYLVTAARAGARLPRCGNVTVVVSENHQLPEGFGVAHHRVPVSRADLLADPSVAKILAEAGL